MINYFENANMILVSGHKAAYAYKNVNKEGKRKLIEIVFSNRYWESGQLLYEFKQPFDIIEEMNRMRPSNKVKLKTKSLKNKI